MNSTWAADQELSVVQPYRTWRTPLSSQGGCGGGALNGEDSPGGASRGHVVNPVTGSSASQRATGRGEEDSSSSPM
ncbi:hypothetical protein J116_026205 [Streptomyces thermolilacinus SPC6]|uniref:Uncharacterized protein n=1 Tax=Streptomyces thermolilacinus SPC6 TaxID=1306406 RepID=A0A1D3DYN0_9ACTN|nr:hypothetical protein J116_026205 [Streptomyces thermolilacinus SPC6]